MSSDRFVVQLTNVPEEPYYIKDFSRVSSPLGEETVVVLAPILTTDLGEARRYSRGLVRALVDWLEVMGFEYVVGRVND